MRIHQIKIPVKPHVYKFLVKEFSNNYHVSENDFIGPLLIQFLRRPENGPEELKSVNLLTHKWEIEYPNHLFEKRGVHYFGSKNIITFNTCVDAYMKHLLLMKVREYLKRGDQQKLAILDFMAEYEITESDLSFDGWKKAIQRLKLSKKITRRSVP